MVIRFFGILVGALWLFSWPAQAVAGVLEGEKTIRLVQADGTEREIGTVTFTPSRTGSAYKIDWHGDVFSEHFLSMRPFKCIEGAAKNWCHVPYPYEIKRSVTSDDLTDLEYDLLFLWKGSTNYGINMWNGVYYKLAIKGGKIVGGLHEMDMNTLSVPPEKGELRPVKAKHIEEGDPDSHWLPRVIIY